MLIELTIQKWNGISDLKKNLVCMMRNIKIEFNRIILVSLEFCYGEQGAGCE